MFILKKSIFLLLSFIFVIQVYSQIPVGYYNSAQGLYGQELQQALHDIIDNHVVATYDELHTHYQTTDKRENGTVWDMYSDNPDGENPYEYTFGTTCGNYNSEFDCYNREHSWPKSWFNDDSPMYSDLFHVYPTDGWVNGKRSNYPFGEANSPSWTSMNGSKVGTCTFPGYSGIIFEPIDAYKGDFARSYFYMSTRYFGEDAGWDSSPMVNGAQLLPWAMRMMLEWNEADPVSQKEIDRNDAVFGIQENRNPFIDHPEYAMEIWRYDFVDIDLETNLSINCSDSVSINPSIIYFDESILIYSWLPGTGLSDSTILNPIANPIETTKYVLTVNSENGSIETDSIIITVLTNIDVNFESDQDSIFETPFTFEITNTSANISDYIFTWNFGNDSTFVNNDSIFNFEYTDIGTYNVSLLATDNQTACFKSIVKENYLYTYKDTSSTIENIHNISRYKVYPNPTRDYIYIELENTKQADYSVQIINPLGQTVYEANSVEQIMKIDLKQFNTTGIYFISIFDSKTNRTEIRKIVLEIFE